MAQAQPGPDVNPQRHGHRLYEIDFLRFIAALMVVLLHYSYGHSKGQSDVSFADTIGSVTKYGYLGVNLFFMISGMVVFMTLWGRSTSQFVISRVSRLYPAYWVAVTLTALTVVVLGAPGRSGVSLSQYLINMTMFAEIVNVPYVEAVYWTLWSEWRFYALLFALSLVGLTLRRTHIFMWGWLTVSVLLGILPLSDQVAQVLALVVQPIYSHYFVGGMALYLVYRFGWTKNLGLLLLCSYVNAVYQGVKYARGHETALFQFSGATTAIVITAIFLVMTLAATGRLTRWSRPAFTRLGEMTYPLYLIHTTIGYVLINALSPAVNPWFSLVGTIMFMCFLSWLISRQVEARLRPIMRRSLTRRWAATCAQTVALRARWKGRTDEQRAEPFGHVVADGGSQPLRGRRLVGAQANEPQHDVGGET